MKIKSIVICLLIILVTFSSVLYAISDEEVKHFITTDEAFAKAEKRINSVWNQLDNRFKDMFRDEQIEWIKTKRDQEAQFYINLGLSKVDAYTLVTDDRSNYLIKWHKEFIEIINYGKENGGDEDYDGKVTNKNNNRVQKEVNVNPFIGTWQVDFGEDFIYSNVGSSFLIFTENEMIMEVKTSAGNTQERKNIVYKIHHPEYYICDHNGQKCSKVEFINKDLIVYPLSPIQSITLTRLK
ncbi:MAG: hypothetical protein LBG48_04655 [Rickettsiales bacterium]|jgi:hypothetical protein|nr:hypothetical protein [Rickettsiales bacterium]